MIRRDFLKVCGLLGITPCIASCSSGARAKGSQYKGEVLIIGSGAAGMSAGLLLNQRGVGFSILEASTAVGGRMKEAEGFVDFPLPLGAEWLHVHSDELAQITSSPDSLTETELRGYSGQETVGHYSGGTLSYSSVSEAFGSEFRDTKFVNSTWYRFFRDNVLPAIEPHIHLDTRVTSLQYEGDSVVATDTNGVNHEAGKAIVTVPLKVLQQGDIAFQPSLPEERMKTIQRAPIWGGIKIFFEFSKKFYPTFLTFDDSETDAGQRMYFDAAHAQRTSTNVLGLFAVGEQARPYQEVSGDDQLHLVLEELDRVFDQQASRSYMKHVVQDWDAEPFIHSAYLADNASPSIPRRVSAPIENKLYFAGDGYTRGQDWGGVHNATQSARLAVDQITM